MIFHESLARRPGSAHAAPAGAVLDVTTLRPCPFCGGEARVEGDPWMEGSFRIACGNDACRVLPRTEYLLACYAAELRAVWNRRPSPVGDAEAPPGR